MIILNTSSLSLGVSHKRLITLRENMSTNQEINHFLKQFEDGYILGLKVTKPA